MAATMNGSKLETESTASESSSSSALKDFILYFSYGNVLVIISFYWLKSVLRKYCKAEVTYDRFVTGIWFPSYKKCKCLADYNIFMLVFLFALGLAAGVSYKGFDTLPSSDNLHIIIACLFMVVHCFIANLHLKNVWLPPGVDYISLMMTYLASTITLTYHMHNNDQLSSLDVHLHVFVVICMALAAFVVLLEMGYPSNLTIPLMRCYFTMLQGIWLCHIGVTRYSYFQQFPKWAVDFYQTELFLIVTFVSLCICVFLFLLIYTNCARRRLNKTMNKNFRNDNVQTAESEQLITSDRRVTFQ